MIERFQRYFSFMNCRVPRLTKLELKKIFKGKPIYLLLLGLVLITIVMNTGSNKSYQQEVRIIREPMSERIVRIESGVLVVFEEAFPENFNWREYPLVDEESNPIPENVELYKGFFEDYSDKQIEALTSAGGMFSFSNIIKPGLIVTWIPVFSIVIAVIVFAFEYGSGQYRLIMSRGIRRRDLMWAKASSLVVITFLFSTLLIMTLLITSLIDYNNFGVMKPPDISLVALWDIYWVFLFMFFAYMMVGGVIATVVASPVSAMMTGLVIAVFFPQIFIPGLTPCDDFVMSAVSPLSLGYNFNSLIHLVWYSVEDASCYRSISGSIVGTVAYIVISFTLIQYVFGSKDLKG